jgi:hypothetical protein
MKSRFERIALAASELRGSFEDRVLRVKFSLIQEQAAKNGTPQPCSNCPQCSGGRSHKDRTTIPTRKDGKQERVQATSKKGTDLRLDAR